MMTKPLLILDQHFRQLEELFDPDTYAALAEICDIEGGQNWPMAADRVDALIDRAAFYIAANPRLDADQITRAGHLKAVIEVSGAFQGGLDYGKCADHGIEVLSCSPGFRHSVAEMTLTMMLAGGRGLVAEHEAMRQGHEHWVDDRAATDFSLFGQTIGFIGYGQIAQETTRLLAPFAPEIMAFDPFMTAADVPLVALNTLIEKCRVVVVAAVPSEETRGLLNADLIGRLQRGALVVLISRAWCVDFPALVAAAEAGHIQLATDVFPKEPLAADAPLRQARNVILSPHRAAAVSGGRHPIGRMILADVKSMLDGRPTRQLKRVQPAQLDSQIAAQDQVSRHADVKGLR